MSIKRISITGLIKNPKFSGVYKDYNKLSVDECKDLITYLYSGSRTGWENPLTGKDLNRNSKIIVSFLSYCYYILDDGSKVDIEGHRLSYREHILQFIDEVYLYEKGRVSVSAATQLAQTSTPTRGSPHSPHSPKGSPQAARGAPAGAKSSSSSAKMSYSPTAINKTAQSMQSLSVAANKLTEEKCLNFVKEIRRLKKGLSAAEIKTLKIKNPITGAMIGFKSPIFQSFLLKCYNTFDNAELKKAIRKVVSKKFLDDLDAQIKGIKTAQQSAADKAKETMRLAEEKKKAAVLAAAQAAIAKEKEDREKNKPICDKQIEDCMKDFHKCCDDLEAACDKDGVLAEYIHITKVVNAIVVVILTKYLHLPYYYEDLYKNKMYDAPLPITLFMFDDTIKDYYEEKRLNVVAEMIDYAYNKGSVVYQHNELKQNVSKNLIDTIQMSSEAHYINTLLNRQFIFEIKKRDWDDGGRRPGDLHFVSPSVVYNHYNELDMRKYMVPPYTSLQFPHTLKYATTHFKHIPFNYNITNSFLPQTIFVSATDEVLRTHAPFSELIGEINQRLMNMPRITGIAKEATDRDKFYEGVLKGMERQSFGTNDVIRRNIMYSLNAQTPDYVARAHNYYQHIFYNYGYTGMFPIFTWMPSTLDTYGCRCTLSYIHMWQPFGYEKNKEFQALGNAYKNHGISPWSKMLNDAIYKVITKAHSSVLDIPNTQTEKDRLLMRVMDTLGVYKSMDIDAKYSNKNVYFYHGTANRLHTMKDRDNDIQILGFLSTSLNIYTASYYSEVVTRGAGYIYIIECDDKKGYVNLNDQLYQFILLPNSILRIVYEFNRGAHTIILCRLIMTPTKEENNALYENLLGMFPVAGAAGAAGAAGSTGGKVSAKAKASMVVCTAKALQNVKAAATVPVFASQAPQGTIIKPKADMRKIGDMPADIREYYGLTLTEQNKNEKVDINNGCYVRLINRKVVDRMLADRV